MTNLIVHFGLGAFHRAHQAAYLQRLWDAGDTGWSIVSGNVRPDSADIAPILRQQGCAYTLEIVSPAGRRRYETLRSIADAIPYVPGIPELVGAAASEPAKIISFTVTEAGYFLDAQDELDLDAPELAADLAAAQAGLTGTTIYGAIAAVLRARMLRGSGPVTLLCCDNLRHNGDRFRSGMRQFLALLGDAQLLLWFERHTSCPNAMVDRITPRATPALRERVRLATGRDDAAAVTSEEFIQWVIEDDFCNGRPAWQGVGARMVASVAPFEEAKIRILNASHSCIAWAGALAGYAMIHEAVRDARIARLAHEYVTGAVFDCLHPSPVDLPVYRDLVMQRFAGDAIEDTIERVAADGFSKLPGFIVPTIRERLARGLDIDCVAVLPALFLLFLQRLHGRALAMRYHDPGLDMETLNAVCASTDPVTAFAGIPVLWDELADDDRLVSALRAATQRARLLLSV
jgi:D-arabinitol 4-dehydrogenase